MRKSIALMGLGFFLMTLGLVGCGMQGAPDFARGQHTPIPTLPQATMPPMAQVLAQQGGAAAAPCRTTPVDVLIAWFKAGVPGPEAGSFTMTDLDGNTCQLSFKDVQYVFSTPGIWYQNSPACTNCHSGDPQRALGHLSLDSYEHIMAREEITEQGNWEASLLHERLIVRKDMPLGRPPNSPEKGLEIFVGKIAGK